MKKIAAGAFAVASGLCSTAAMAQVTVYGIVDVGIERVSNTNAAGDSAVKMPSLTGSLPSRIGFRGAEDLGGGMQAVFTLETGFAPDTGTVGDKGSLTFVVQVIYPKGFIPSGTPPASSTPIR